MKQVIETSEAPKAVGSYSKAVENAGLLYVSGQIPSTPVTMTTAEGGIDKPINQVLDILSAIAQASGATLNNTIKFTIYHTDLRHFLRVNNAMAARLERPYPARVALEVSGRPKSTLVGIDAIIAFN